MNFEVGKAYYIEWFDHWSQANAGWSNYKDQLEPIIIKSIGWCVAGNDTVVRLAGHINPIGEDFSGEANIMISSVKDAWELTNI